MTRRQQDSSEDLPPPFGSLSDKQWDAIRTATEMGFFQRPQQATAEEVATRLDITRSTFLYHLRAAEHQVFSAVCSPDSPE
jgi:predicted DNA binding protein